MLLDRPGRKTRRQVAWGSDIAAQMLRRFGIPYVSLNPGASYRGLHDSVVNHLGNETPGMLLCLHEDHAVSIAHGYAKATGEPMACFLHSNVGLMHGMMGLYNAWCDRVPMMVLGATGPLDSDKRRPWIDWIHTSRDQGGLIRSFIKWDDLPASPAGAGRVDVPRQHRDPHRRRPPRSISASTPACRSQRLDKEPDWPDLAALHAAGAAASRRATPSMQAADLLKDAKKPLILFGRGIARRRRPGSSASTSPSGSAPA